MHAHALLALCGSLLQQVLRWDDPADAAVARFAREHRSLGPRERQCLSQAVFDFLRRRTAFEAAAKRSDAPVARPVADRLSLLLLPADLVAPVLTPAEKSWWDLAHADLAHWQRGPIAGLPAGGARWHNLPEWLVGPLREACGEAQWVAFCESLLTPAPLDLRVNTGLAKRDALLRELQAEGLAAVPCRHSPWGIRLEGKPSLGKLDAYRRGAVDVQDEGSQLLALLCEAKRDQLIVDFCAGAGGKTLALGAMMRGTGRLYAFDTSAHRLEGLRPRLERAGLTNVHTAALAHERDERASRLAGKADCVLVDAPCSGLGTLRRSPDIKWRLKSAEIEGLGAKQGEILAAAARLVKPGGRLVYATCSPLRAEDEAVAEAFDAGPGWSPIRVAEILARQKLATAAELCEPDGRFLRLWPHRHGTDGFFAAVWARR